MLTLVEASILAPFSSNSFTMLLFPHLAATCRQVRALSGGRTLAGKLTSAPFSRSREAMLLLP
ncbi:unnamed protein product [Ixodes persulcatus]